MQARTLGFSVLLALLFAATAGAQTQNGRLAGVVLDFAGKPQMGATVWVAPAGLSGAEALRARTTQAGRFLVDKLPVGAYTVRVTLGGFLPVLARNVVVSANATTVLKLELDSVFSSVARMRQPPKSGAEPDDWDWVLRSSADTRPVLRWNGDDDGGSADRTTGTRTPRARVELTSGGTEPGMVSSLTQSSFAYDQPIGVYGNLLLAGQFSYDGTGTAGLATTWAPFGSSTDAPRTTFALQQFRIGQETGPMLRTLRSEQAGSAHVGGRVTIRYTAEYVCVSLRDSASALHPRADVAVQVSRNWTATISVGSQPANGQVGPADLESAVSQLGVFPAVMFHNGNPTIGNGWHEELRLERRMLKYGTLSFAGFRDQSSHTAVFATSVGGDVPLDALPIPHAVDGGAISNYGARAAYRQKLSASLEAAVIYAWAGVLTADVPLDGAALQALLKERSRNSLALTVDGKVKKSGTRFTAGYKWVEGLEVSRQDPYGEALYDADPYLNVSVRQALPAFLGGRKLEAVADLLNVLGEGTVYRNTPEGRVGLTSEPRVLRGGLSFQF